MVLEISVTNLDGERESDETSSEIVLGGICHFRPRAICTTKHPGETCDSRDPGSPGREANFGEELL